ncbi:MAG: DUF1559 domain-containing protein [Planctomycetales bacterium]|nr:DUF1559 domain-containing protein [Planctomycetales bacterium]
MPSLLNSQCKSHRSLRWLMALLMLATPTTASYAESPKQVVADPDQTLLTYPDLEQPGETFPTEPLNLDYVFPNAAGVIALRPRQLLTSQALQMLPIEVVSAAGLQQLGFDPVDLTQIVISATPPLAGPFEYAAVVQLAKPIDLSSLSEELIGHTAPSVLDGKPYLKSKHPMLPSLYWAAEKTLLIAPDATLQQLLKANRDSDVSSEDALLPPASPGDVLISLDLDKLRPVIQMGLFQAMQKAPPTAQPFLEIPNRLKRIDAKFTVSGAGPCDLSAEANNSADADRISELIDLALQMYADAAAAQAAAMLASDDPIQQAMGRYTLRITPAWAEQMKPTRDGDRFILWHFEPSGEPMNAMLSTATIGVLVALLLPAVQAAREAARRNTSMNNMKQIMLALLNYESAFGHFPAHANYDNDGKPLLSWRVHILPFLEQQNLYDAFHLDEPWDSEHNQKLIARMPELFVDPSSGLSPEEGKTHYLGVSGKGYAFDGTDRELRMKEFTDGLSNSIMILQVEDDRATTWTKPDDWQLDKQKPLKGLTGSMHPGTFLAGFADGHVRSFPLDTDPVVFQHMLTIAGSEPLPRE